MLHPVILQAQDVDQRAETVLAALRVLPIDTGGGKQPYGAVAARLAADPANAEALAYTAETGMGGIDAPFNALYRVRAYQLGKAHFTSAQRLSVQADAQAIEEWNPDYTENHRVLLWSSAYLFAQEFPNGQWTWDGQLVGSAALMAAVRDELIRYGQGVFDRGYSEFLSPSYDLYKVAAWMNLYDLAADPEVKAIADAMLTYHFTLLALASLDEVVLPPYSRGPNAVFSSTLQSASQWIHWLFWGLGGVNAAQAVDPARPEFILALSSWRPPPVVDKIATGTVATPYAFRTRQPFFFAGDPLHMVRTSYRDTSYAMSSGVYRMDMDGLSVYGNRQLVHDDAFAVAWRSTSQLRYLSVMHPYWNGVAGDLDWTSRLSPFMQVVQHRNAAIVAFDIPAADPWLAYDILWTGAGTRADAPLAVAELRYPFTGVVYTPTWGDDWISLEAGETCIAIKVLQPGWLRDRRGVAEQGFHLIVSRGTQGERWRTGFLIICANSAEYPSVGDFMAAVMAQPLSVDWESGAIGYTTPDGRALLMQYTHSEVVPDFSVPAFSVDGVTVDYGDWPRLESPWTSLDGAVLEIINDDAGNRFVVDWSAEVPVLETRAIEQPPTWAGFPVDNGGWVDTGAFMGWIYPVGPWVFSDLLGKYVYLPDSHVGPGGAWMFAP